LVTAIATSLHDVVPAHPISFGRGATVIDKQLGHKTERVVFFTKLEVQKIVILAKAGIQIYSCIQAFIAHPWIPAFARMTDFVSVHVAISIAARCFGPVTIDNT
jgi:hypothetical protein